MRIILATRNRDKIKEIVAILAPLDVELVTLDEFPDVPDVVEDGKTLEANALKKARAMREATGLCALADDTGLEVDALGGAPGVYSSRYSGAGATYQDNMNKLLSDLRDVPEGERSARFRCVIATALTGDAAASVAETMRGSEPLEALVSEGIVEGRISTVSRGQGGFGYDPVFEVASSGRTLAEMSAEEKNQISHRYRALVEMRELLLRCGLARERT